MESFSGFDKNTGISHYLCNCYISSVSQCLRFSENYIMLRVNPSNQRNLVFQRHVNNALAALYWRREVREIFYLATLTYLLTPWCRVLPEQLTGLQLVKKFPAFHGTRRFITALTSIRHLSLSWASPIQSIYPYPTSWRSILILSTHLQLGLPSGSFPPVSPPRPYTLPSPRPYAPHAQPISFFLTLSPAQYWVRSTNHLAPRYVILA